MSSEAVQFVFMTCRPGAEPAVKAEASRVAAAWRLAFSRPGFLTFKLPAGAPLDDRRLSERSWTFAHACGISLGPVRGRSLADLAAAVWRTPAVASLIEAGDLVDLHVWQVEGEGADAQAGAVGDTPLCREIDRALRAFAPAECTRLRRQSGLRRKPAPRGERVLDVVVLQPGEWWIGHHRAVRRHQRWPGGMIPARLPDHAVSRAYIKLDEAVRWSGLPLAAGDECVEIGCAPGGTSQALLERGLFVTGIDPAEVAPAVLEHPRFRHLRKRVADVRRTEFQGVRWLVADMNIAPQATLDEVESIVTHRGLAIQGMILTLKLSDWMLATQLPRWVSRVHGWGYRHVRTRQLSTGGKEICLLALRRKELQRLRRSASDGRRPRHGARIDAAHPAPPPAHF